MTEMRKIPTSQLIPYTNNSRTHSESQIKQVAASIKEFGFLNPVITDGQNGIVAGHCRVMAAELLGLDEVPCLEASHLTEAQKKAYVIADNKLAENAGWDDEMLRIELSELNDLHFDLSTTGFTEEELLAMEYGDNDKQPEEKNTNTEDKWQLLIEYETEEQLAAAYDKTLEEGLPCKIIQ